MSERKVLVVIDRDPTTGEPIQFDNGTFQRWVTVKNTTVQLGQVYQLEDTFALIILDSGVVVKVDPENVHFKRKI